MIPLEKPGTPEEIVHFGVKGMKWGVRKERDSPSKKPRTPAEQARYDHRVKVAKRVAIGAGILVVVAGTGFVAYKLHQNGKLPLSKIKPSSEAAPVIKKTFDPPTQIIHSSRGKTRGYQFFQKGGLTDPEGYMIAKGLADVPNGSFSKLDDGSIATRILDPLKRLDQSGRPIGHDIVIPKSMASGINNVKDVEEKIWPLIKDAYDET